VIVEKKVRIVEKVEVEEDEEEENPFADNDFDVQQVTQFDESSHYFDFDANSSRRPSMEPIVDLLLFSPEKEEPTQKLFDSPDSGQMPAFEQLSQALVVVEETPVVPKVTGKVYVPTVYASKPTAKWVGPEPKKSNVKSVEDMVAEMLTKKHVPRPKKNSTHKDVENGELVDFFSNRAPVKKVEFMQEPVKVVQEPVKMVEVPEPVKLVEIIVPAPEVPKPEPSSIVESKEQIDVLLEVFNEVKVEDDVTEVEQEEPKKVVKVKLPEIDNMTSKMARLFDERAKGAEEKRTQFVSHQEEDDTLLIRGLRPRVLKPLQTHYDHE